MERAVEVVDKEATTTTLPPPGTVVTGTFQKETVDAQTGIAIRKQHNRIMISGVLPDSLAAKNTELQAGLQITSINDTAVEGLNTEEAAKLLVESEGTVTVVTVVPEPEAVEAPKAQAPEAAKVENGDKKSPWCCF